MSRVASQTYASTWAITWPGLMRGNQRSCPYNLIHIVRRVRRRGRRPSGIGGRHRSQWTAKLDRRFQDGKRPMMVTLHAISPEAMTTYSDRLSALFRRRECLREISRIDGMAGLRQWMGSPPSVPKFLRLHDASALTTIRAVPERYTPDHQQPCEPGYSFYSTTQRITCCLSLGNSL